MISVIFIALAGICSAIQDISAHHYNKSIFKRLKPEFWNAAISWKNKYISIQTLERKKLWFFNYPVQLSDSWHLFKMLKIIFWVLSVVLYVPILTKLTDFALFGVVLNVSFNSFYNHILKSE